eukprot:4394227-Prymnesium_polylepis.1
MDRERVHACVRAGGDARTERRICSPRRRRIGATRAAAPTVDRIEGHQRRLPLAIVQKRTDDPRARAECTCQVKWLPPVAVLYVALQISVPAIAHQFPYDFHWRTVLERQVDGQHTSRVPDHLGSIIRISARLGGRPALLTEIHRGNTRTSHGCAVHREHAIVVACVQGVGVRVEHGINDIPTQETMLRI